MDDPTNEINKFNKFLYVFISTYTLFQMQQDPD